MEGRLVAVTAIHCTDSPDSPDLVIIFSQILLEGQEKEALQRYGKAPAHLQLAVQVRKDWTTSWREQLCVLTN